MNTVKLLATVAKVLELLRDPTIAEAFRKLVEFFKSLNPDQQAAFASKYLEAAEFGCNGDECPDCPTDALVAAGLLRGLVQGDE